MSADARSGRAAATLRWLRGALGMGAALVAWWTAGASLAQTSAVPVAERDIGQWLQRMHEAARGRAFVGTFVVSSGGDHLATARIWHVCDGRQQFERIDALTGVPRTTVRRDDQVLTFYPENRVVRSARHESLGGFPALVRTGDSSIPDFYRAQRVGAQRVAGHDADVIELRPRDAARFGYRVWSEQRTGLVVKLQTLDAAGRVLEQAAFSELQLDAAIKPEKIAREMSPGSGWRVDTVQATKTTADAEGWTLRSPVAGFRPVSCHRRPAGDGRPDTVQWTFSDGLALVSLFVEAFDAQRHVGEGTLVLGATHTLRQRLELRGKPWWVTAVGEVPLATLQAFVEGLDRLR